MIKIYSAAQIREWDKFTIEHEPISAEGLMERASAAFVNWFTEEFTAKEKIAIVCGKGNNGGDGIVIGRLLSERKYDVKVFELKKELVTSFDSFTVIVDAIFGSGLTRAVQSPFDEIIKKINSSKAIKVSVDVPSGLMVDAHSEGDIVKADYTITFQVPKLALLMPENAEYVGEWKSVNIGLSSLFKSDTKTFYVDRVSIKKRDKFAHKGDFGRALIIAGSLGKMGACVLSTRAALRSGVGLLTVHVPKCGYNIIQTSVPEAMATVDRGEDHFSDAGDASHYDVIGIGPGIGITASTVSGLRKVLQAGKPMVLDADALNILSSSRELMQLIPGGSILTPHPSEFKRLVGEWKHDFDRLEKQKQLANQTRSVVIVKGAYTSIASPDGEVYFNSTGNPGMAKGGSGDVLTGVLTGLLSQKYSPLEAAIIGVFCHGRAGDLAAAKLGENSVLAGDLVENLGQSFSH